MNKRNLVKFLENIDYAFQPIVSISGKTFAFEALIRGTEDLGFKNIKDFFDFLAKEKILFLAECILRKKVVLKFTKIPFHKDVKLFYNYDPRVLEMPDYEELRTDIIIEKYGLKNDAFCLEANEKNHYDFSTYSIATYERARMSGFNFALDDFGVANSNFQLLYYIKTDFIKIDRFFVSNIDKDNKKRFFCQKIIEIGHTIGAKVLAEGVETIKEYFTLKSLGVDGIQGYLVAKPTLEISNLHQKYTGIENLYESDRRKDERKDSHKDLILSELKVIPPVYLEDDIVDILSKFMSLKDLDFLPVLDSNNWPVGVIKEKDLRNYTYSPFGKDLLSNKSYRKKAKDFLVKFAIADVNSSIESLLNSYSLFYDTEGVIIKNENKYIGFLEAKSIIRIITEMKINEAKDLNPLTKLPGNISINEKLELCLNSLERVSYVLYYDFDNFKPFNDKFGFRLGDRIILGFAEILQKSNTFEKFTGHVGGDDFIQIIYLDKEDVELVIKYFKEIRKKFLDFCSPFYTEKEKMSGFYFGKNREGVETQIPLVDVSCVILEISKRKNSYNEITFSNMLGELKKSAKMSLEKFCLSTLL